MVNPEHLEQDFMKKIACFLAAASLAFPALARIDLRAEALRHHASIGLEVAAFDARLTCCEARIGIDAMTYAAYRGRWEQFDWIMRRTEETLKRSV
jgi:hypothetical protein